LDDIFTDFSNAEDDLGAFIYTLEIMEDYYFQMDTNSSEYLLVRRLLFLLKAWRNEFSSAMSRFDLFLK
jgi:hypothetical protein